MTHHNHPGDLLPGGRDVTKRLQRRRVVVAVCVQLQEVKLEAGVRGLDPGESGRKPVQQLSLVLLSQDQEPNVAVDLSGGRMKRRRKQRRQNRGQHFLLLQREQPRVRRDPSAD